MAGRSTRLPPGPALHDLPLSNSEDHDRRQFDRPAGGWPVEQRAGIRAPQRPADCDAISLGDKGVEALGEWARTPVRFTPLKSELLVRLLIADLVGEAATRESIVTLREGITDLFAPRRDQGKCQDAASSAQVPLARHWIPSPATRASPRTGRRRRARTGTEEKRPIPANAMTPEVEIKITRARGRLGRTLRADATRLHAMLV